MKFNSFSRIIILMGICIAVFTGLTLIQFPAAGSIFGNRQSVQTVVPTEASSKKQAKTQQAVQFMGQVPISAELWNKEIDAWRDTVWSVVSGSRFNADAVTWKFGTEARFDEKTFLAYMVETLRRGRSVPAFVIPITRAQHRDALTWASMPFVGMSVPLTALFDKKNAAQVKEIEKDFRSKSPELFYKEDIASLLFDRMSPALSKEILEFAQTADFSSASAEQAVMLINAYIDTASYIDAAAENPFVRALDLLDTVLIPAVQKADNGFFVVSEADGTCSTLVSIKAGKALMRLAELTGKTMYAGMGQSLVRSCLQLAGDDGTIPASLDVRAAPLKKSSETISIGILYPVLTDSPYYPHAVSFYKQLGPGLWAWTSSPSLAARTNVSNTLFTARYPEGQSHYIVLYGIRPFSKVQLYGIDYPMDADFETYNASGYFYLKPATTLYIKMKHKQLDEHIQLFFDN